MNRVEIKELAKSKIKGNKWNIIWPMLIITVVTSIISSVMGVGTSVDLNNVNTLSTTTDFSSSNFIISLLISLLSSIVSAGYIKYILNFVRTGNFNTRDIFDTIKEKWLNIIIAFVLMTLIVGLCMLFFVVPGIIMALAYTFAFYIIIDSDTKGNDALKASREMMNGYKWNYFVFELSFIGWILLIPFTFGLILIWLCPYVTVANTLYYEKLKDLKNK